MYIATLKMQLEMHFTKIPRKFIYKRIELEPTLKNNGKTKQVLFLAILGIKRLKVKGFISSNILASSVNSTLHIPIGNLFWNKIM